MRTQIAAAAAGPARAALQARALALFHRDNGLLGRIYAAVPRGSSTLEILRAQLVAVRRTLEVTRERASRRSKGAERTALLAAAASLVTAADNLRDAITAELP